MLEKIYEQYKEGLSKSDHKILGYLMEHEREIQAVTAGTCQSGLVSVRLPSPASGRRLVLKI